MLVPADRLPPDAAARHAALRDYFCDKDAEAVVAEGGWRLSLEWPDGVDRHVDPRLDEGLVWWGDGVGRATMAGARRRRGVVLSTLYDSWTLHSWSEWLARTGAGAEDVVVLHVDDHRDLDAPRLAVQGGGWRDLVTGERVSMEDPASVAAAIRSGAIGMGSFMTPFLHAMPRTEVRHLCQAHKASATADYRIGLVHEADTLLEPGASRPAVRLVPALGRTGPSHYRTTPSPADWLEGIGSGPILLHVDLDYFNNRYDGDSDWEDRAQRHDADADAVSAAIRGLARVLGEAGLVGRIADVSIAFSPGFFPAELWGMAGDLATSVLSHGR